MNDTPRTNSQPIYDSNGCLFTLEQLFQNKMDKDDPYKGGFREFVDADFARMLEREIIELKQKYEKENSYKTNFN